MANPAITQSLRDLAAAFSNSERFGRLDDLGHLWLAFAGRRDNYRPLHEQRIHGRTVIPVQDPGFHLTWTDDCLFVRPLPSGLSINALDRTTGHLDSRVCGFLYSYTRLIQSELDFRLAVESKLINGSPRAGTTAVPDPDWQDWTAFTDRIEQRCAQLLPINSNLNYRSYLHPRYHYGDLRINRLNLVIGFRSFGTKHFFHAKSRHLGFWNSYTKWAILLFAYLSVILTGMQVCLATAYILPNWFVTACRYFGYVAVAFSLALVAIALVVYGLWIFFQVIGWLYIIISRR